MIFNYFCDTSCMLLINNFPCMHLYVHAYSHTPVKYVVDTVLFDTLNLK